MALKSPEKPVGFGRGARSRIAANVILASVLAVVFAVFVNYFVAQLGDDHDLRLDMTREKRSELDPTTKELIRSIETPIDCYLVFGMDDTLRRAARMTPDARTPDTGLVQGEYRPFLANLAEQVRFLLEEARILNANLRVHLVDADVEVDTPNRWSRELSLGKGQLVNHLVFHDAKSKRKEVYSLFRLFDLDLGGPDPTRGFRRPESRGDFIEMHLVQALRSLTSERTRIAGLAAGQGEIPLLVLRQLFEGWDVDVRDLPLDQGQAIPQDLDFLVIASPERDWRPESLEQVRRWFEAGGRILLLQGSRCRELHRDLLASVGLRPLAAQVGHPTQHERARGLYHLAGYRLLQPTEGQSAHAITSTAVRDALPIELGFARPYDLLSDYESDRVTRNMVMHSSEGGLLMPWIHDGKDWRQAEDRGTKQGDFLLAAAVERAPGPGGGEPGRMVVIGSDEWLDGRLLLGGFNLANLDVLSNTVDWLTGRDRRIFGTPRSFRGDLAKLDRDSIRGFRYLTVGILPGMLVLMGLLVFLLRRR